MILLWKLKICLKVDLCAKGIEQDEDIDGLLGTVKGIRRVAEGVNGEVDKHLQIIYSSDKTIDQVTEDIAIVDNRLKIVIRKANACCLWTIIVLEMIAIFIIILWML